MNKRITSFIETKEFDTLLKYMLYSVFTIIAAGGTFIIAMSIHFIYRILGN